jgi:catechol 2,3-dioxygenase-like lactoylglutathione lyase family enzyme|tara:strand:+ start:2942 stop:3328 length:387 start_codon:yes stop_codon:yes gene_type:complete
MRGYVMVGTNDLDKSEKFYNKLLDTVGLKKIYGDEGCVGYGQKTGPEVVEFYITMPANGEPATYGNGTQISFLSNTRAEVDKFHATGIENGGVCEGLPGLRPEGASTYYSYVRDLNGNKVCAYTDSKD